MWETIRRVEEKKRKKVMIDRRDTNRKRDPLHVYFFVLEHGLLIDMICSNKWKYNNVDLNIWVNFDIR